MKITLSSIFATSFLLGSVMGAVLNADEIRELPGAGKSWNITDVLEEVNGADKGDEPYVIAEFSFKPLQERDYYQAARWICLAWQKGYHDGNAISGWLDDWKRTGRKDDIRELVRDPKNHEMISKILAEQWEKDHIDDEGVTSDEDEEVDR